jgi:hypothetical protein
MDTLSYQLFGNASWGKALQSFARRERSLDTGGVALTPGSTGATASLGLPAEAFVRLVYGRLDDDADVTSAVGVTVPELQAVFPGL